MIHLIGTPPSRVWAMDTYDPRNTIGRDVIADEHRTKLILRCRVGNSSRFLTIEDMPHNGGAFTYTIR